MPQASTRAAHRVQPAPARPPPHMVSRSGHWKNGLGRKPIPRPSVATYRPAVQKRKWRHRRAASAPYARFCSGLCGLRLGGAMVLDRAKPRERSEAILAALPVARGYPGLVQTAADIPDLAGAYVLVIDLAEPVRVTIGGHTWRLESGRYLYCGSAHGPGGLHARVARHMRRGKPIRWHVDQLTERGRVRGALTFPGRRECALAAQLAHLPVPIPGFGSSDCRRCASHLFAWPEGAPPWPALRRRGERRIQRSGPAPQR